MEITLKPVDFSDVEQVERPTRLSKRSKAVAGDIVQLLNSLDAYEAPELPVEQYLDNRAGRYAKMLEAIVDVAAQLGMFDLARVTLVDLLRMTKVGRAKADLTLGTKLREEMDFKHKTQEELEAFVAPND